MIIPPPPTSSDAPEASSPNLNLQDHTLIDIWREIATHLDLFDKVKLSRSSRFLRATLKTVIEIEEKLPFAQRALKNLTKIRPMIPKVVYDTNPLMVTDRGMEAFPFVMPCFFKPDGEFQRMEKFDKLSPPSDGLLKHNIKVEHFWPGRIQPIDCEIGLHPETLEKATEEGRAVLNLVKKLYGKIKYEFPLETWKSTPVRSRLK